MAKIIKTVTYFDRCYKKLPQKIKEKAKEREQIFREDVFDPRLRTHKLHGKNKDSWVFWIDHAYRIKFIFLAEEEILFLDVGTHDIYN